MRQFQIKSHILSCFDCLQLTYCFTLANILEATRRDAEVAREDRDYELFSRQYDYEDYEDYEDRRKYDYYDADYRDTDPYDDSSYNGPDEYDYQDEWDDIDYLEEAAECLNFEHHAPKSRIHARPAKDKDKTLWMKKKFVDVKKQKRITVEVRTYARKPAHYWESFRFAFEEQHNRFPLKTVERD